VPLVVAATQEGNGVPRHENGVVASHMELVPRTAKELTLWSVVTGTPHAAPRQLNNASPEAGSGICLLATNGGLDWLLAPSECPWHVDRISRSRTATGVPSALASIEH
jgi:hypothetical protein